jgi:cytochrome c
MIHGEVTHGGIKRVFVEQVDGQYQGAVFRFTQGIEAGVNRIMWGPDGRLYVGGIGNPGNWQHTGGNWHGLQRLTYNGESAFEMLAVRARSNGVEIEFTEPLASNDGFNPDAYQVEQWYYEPTAEYGGPKLGQGDLPVRSVHVSENRRRVFLELGGMKPGHVVYIRLLEPWISANGSGLWSREAWYTMNRIPTNTPGFRSTLSPEVLPPNQLTAAQREAGWRLLFDGETLDGWRGYLAEGVGAAWRVEDGAITLGGQVADWQTLDGGDIMTDETFEDYEFHLEWKISEGGNSGIIYNVVEDSGYEYVWHTGPEYQILDNDRHSDGAIPSHRAGELYDMKALSYDPTNPVGEWNTTRIVQRDGHVEHWMNGHKLLEAQIGSGEWDAMVADSKFASMPAFGKSTSGHIALQDHGNRVWFRDVRLRFLDP